MKKIFSIILVLMLASPVFCQSIGYARRIVPVLALPANCTPANGEVVSLTATGITTLMNCVVANTWKPAGVNTLGQIILSQGTLTANSPAISQSATWNNGAIAFDVLFSNVTDTASAVTSNLEHYQIASIDRFVVTKNASIGLYQPTLTTSQPAIFQSVTWNAGGVTFVNDFRNVTDTASAATSLLAEWQVGGADKFAVGKDGTLTLAAAATEHFAGRSYINSPADGLIEFFNNAVTDFTGLVFGPQAVTNPAIYRSAAVGGVTQGIIILRGDGTAAVQANLGAATNGSIIYCADCTVANPCAGGGNGAIAKRLNNAWVCN